MSPATEMLVDAGEQRSAAGISWVALGDSFTAGTSPGETTWVGLVLERLASQRAVELTNLARVGATVAEMEREQLQAALLETPDLVTLICGGNDVIGRVRPSLDCFAGDLDRIWRRLRHELPTAECVTATYPLIAPDSVRPRTRQRIINGLEQVNGSIRWAARRHGVHCIELAAHPGRGERTNFAADGLHPSADGHRAAAAVIGATLEELTRSRKRYEEEQR